MSFQVFVLLITFMLVLFKFAMVLAYSGQKDNVVTMVYNATTASMFDWYMPDDSVQFV